MATINFENERHVADVAFSKELNSINYEALVKFCYTASAIDKDEICAVADFWREIIVHSNLMQSEKTAKNLSIYGQVGGEGEGLRTRLNRLLHLKLYQVHEYAAVTFGRMLTRTQTCPQDSGAYATLKDKDASLQIPILGENKLYKYASRLMENVEKKGNRPQQSQLHILSIVRFAQPKDDTDQGIRSMFAKFRAIERSKAVGEFNMIEILREVIDQNIASNLNPAKLSPQKKKAATELLREDEALKEMKENIELLEQGNLDEAMSELSDVEDFNLKTPSVQEPGYFQRLTNKISNTFSSTTKLATLKDDKFDTSVALIDIADFETAIDPSRKERLNFVKSRDVVLILEESFKKTLSFKTSDNNAVEINLTASLTQAGTTPLANALDSGLDILACTKVSYLDMEIKDQSIIGQDEPKYVALIFDNGSRQSKISPIESTYVLNAIYELLPQTSSVAVILVCFSNAKENEVFTPVDKKPNDTIYPRDIYRFYNAEERRAFINPNNDLVYILNKK